MLTRHNIYLLVAFMIALLDACSSSADIEQVYPDIDERAINFETHIHTRVSESTVESLKEGFSVWGGYDENVVFDGNIVTYDTSTSTWVYTDGPKYWTKNTYDFQAVYPVSISGATVSYEESALKINGYNIPDHPETDLLIGAAENHDYPSDGPLVNMNFRHALAQVTFHAKKDADAGEVSLNEISLYGPASVGSYNSSSDSWTHTSYTTKNSPFAVSSTKTELDTSTKNALGSLLVFPSSFIPNTYTLYIRYTITYNLSKEVYENTILLASASLDSWEAGKKYNYTFTIIDPNTIIFDPPKVTPWTESNGNVIIVE